MFVSKYISLVNYDLPEYTYYSTLEIKKRLSSRRILLDYKPIEPIMDHTNRISPLQRWYKYLIDLDAIWVIKDIDVVVSYTNRDHWPLVTAKVEILSKGQYNLDISFGLEDFGEFSDNERIFLYTEKSPQQKHELLAPRIEAAAEAVQKVFVEDLMKVWNDYKVSRV
jgi:hypothetical protein